MDQLQTDAMRLRNGESFHWEFSLGNYRHYVTACWSKSGRISLTGRVSFYCINPSQLVLTAYNSHEFEPVLRRPYTLARLEYSTRVLHSIRFVWKSCACWCNCHLLPVGDVFTCLNIAEKSDLIWCLSDRICDNSLVTRNIKKSQCNIIITVAIMSISIIIHSPLQWRPEGFSTGLATFTSLVRVPVITLLGYFWDRWPSLACKLSWDVTTT